MLQARLDHSHMYWVCVCLLLTLGKVPVEVVHHELQQQVELLRTDKNKCYCVTMLTGVHSLVLEVKGQIHPLSLDS